MVRAKLEVDLARLDLRRQSLSSKFFADSHGDSNLYIVAHDDLSGKCIVSQFDRHNYAAFKELFVSTESVAKRLRTCQTVMPTDTIPNDMTLEIDIDSIDLETVTIHCSLSLDRSRMTEVRIMFRDDDSNEYIFIRLTKTDYKRFKDWLRETDGTLEQLYSDRRISERFSIQAALPS
jgi:hypothetical protein